MRKGLSSVIFTIIFFHAFGNSIQKKDLSGVFIQSLKEKKFELLKSYFPSVDFYKSIPGASKKTDAEISGLLKKSNDRLKKNWQMIIEGLKDRKVNIDEIKLRETLIYDPFSAKNEMEAMVVVYNYGAKLWDDLSLIISRWDQKIFLLEIPNPGRAFTFNDEGLKESKRARASIEMSKPEFRNSLEEKVRKIISFVNDNDLTDFATCLVYRGEDENRKWRSELNVNEISERQQAAEFMQKVKRSIKDCNDYTASDIRSERESEGTWIILPMRCALKTVSFAFLQVNNVLLLGDIDTERGQ